MTGSQALLFVNTTQPRQEILVHFPSPQSLVLAEVRLPRVHIRELSVQSTTQPQTSPKAAALSAKKPFAPRPRRRPGSPWRT